MAWDSDTSKTQTGSAEGRDSAASEIGGWIDETKWSRETFLALAEQVPNGIFIHRGGHVLYANRAALEMFGLTQSELYAADFDFRAFMAAESLQRVAQNLARHERGHEVPPQRGLGLAAVQGIVRAHGGAICAQSAHGKGTRFQVVFPALNEPHVAAKAPDRAAPQLRQQLETVVLMADDDPAVASVVKAMLEAGGCSVLVARDGQEAVDLFSERASEISVVLLDAMMPRVNGADAMTQMRALRPEIPVVLCSGYDERSMASRFGAERPSEFLQKPYTMDELFERLAAALGRS
jgi:PAS domain S-box-containing protein